MTTVAHITDIHWLITPTLRQLGAKRLIGSANLYLRGRHKQFSRQVQRSLIENVLSLQPDLCVITGDLTSQATHEEFALARAELQPLFEKVNCLVIPGNHDVYTQGAYKERRIRTYFLQQMHLNSALHELRHQNIRVLGLDPNRPRLLDSTGLVPMSQLNALKAALSEPKADHERLILATHYPIVGRDGSPYTRAWHGLQNAPELISLLDSSATRPDLIIHGHVHHGYHSEVVLSDGARIPSYGSGSSGQAFLPKRGWTAAMNLYTFEDTLTVERFLFDGEGFASEPGGAYASHS